MNQKTNPHLEQAANIQLPACEFCRTLHCRDCFYFETWAPDSKGMCRCSYKGRWYYPDDGCTIGKTYAEARKEELI